MDAESNEAQAVTGRPNDIPLDEDVEYAVPNSTMAERAAARKQGSKMVDDAENKAVTTAATKSRKRK